MTAAGVLAPAKVNLYLHVVGRRADGYHLLDSLVAFADVGDRIAGSPAESLSLTVGGPEAAAIAELGDDNLVLRAARLYIEAARAVGASPMPGAALFLDKRLPTASGIGGGSTDAAAALRLLDHLSRAGLSRTVLVELAARLGADVPACLAARPVWVGGIGELLEPAEGLPPVGIVMANPRIALPTPAVFRARHGPFSRSGRFAAMPRDATELAAMLASRRNDLTQAARRLVPEIAAVLSLLAALPGALLARMSGSGATCFALFTDREAAAVAHATLRRARPEWWSAAGTLSAQSPRVESSTPTGGSAPTSA
ncbi:MAG: 4-(cytidine 5'-diphospho)-2-C-methyl-D-erythritol kinase [Alphaproteobacteria bacterium]